MEIRIRTQVPIFQSFHLVSFHLDNIVNSCQTQSLGVRRGGVPSYAYLRYTMRSN